MAATYRIEDEPRPGGLAHLVVDPVWPLFGFMFAGTWLSWAWLAFNAVAVGSPTRQRETALLVAGALGSVALTAAILVLHGQGALRGLRLDYALLALLAWKLSITYAVHAIQRRSYHLHQYYGGVSRSGLFVVFAAGWWGRDGLGKLVQSDFWMLVLT